MSFGEREKEGFEGFLKIEMKNPRIRIKEIVLLVSLEKEKIKNWRVFGNKESESLGMILLTSLEEKEMKDLKISWEKLKWRIWEFGDERDNIIMMFLEKEEIKNWRVFGNEESKSLKMILLSLEKKEMKDLRVSLDKLKRRSWEFGDIIFEERGNKELESLWK